MDTDERLSFHRRLDEKDAQIRRLRAALEKIRNWVGPDPAVTMREIARAALQEPIEPKPQTRDLHVCHGQGAEGCKDARWMGGEWGTPQCHNPDHHEKEGP